jgi:hypothetical protein
MERWKTIANFEAYEVSDLGRVRRRLPSRTSKVGKLLTPRLVGNTRQLASGKAYLRVGLVKDKKVYYIFVHVLVAKAFVPHSNSKRLTQINHIDGIKTNNIATNLEWRSRRGDRIHAMKLGLQGSGVSFDKGYKKWKAQCQAVPCMMPVALPSRSH